MANQKENTIPKFTSPPVIETVLGVEFTRLEKWEVPHFGIFWNEVRDEFPNIEVKRPLESQIENFDKPKPATGSPFRFLTKPEMRCWFVEEEDRGLIQVQDNRFTYNWRKTTDAVTYPHYEQSIRPAFERRWHQFLDFVKRERLGEVEVVQCEVTYINHLEAGKGWNSASDMNQLFPCWSGEMSGDFLQTPDGVSFDVSYRMPDDKGRLRISMKPAIRDEDGTEIIQLTLTARGKPTPGDSDSVFSWLDMGREWVVRGFTDFTSKQMHALWERNT